MLVVCFNLNDLTAEFALSEHHALSPEMHVKVIVLSKGLISFIAKLTFYTVVFTTSHLFLLRIWLAAPC